MNNPIKPTLIIDGHNLTNLVILIYQLYATD
jgi:hypothetical protein